MWIVGERPSDTNDQSSQIKDISLSVLQADRGVVSQRGSLIGRKDSLALGTFASAPNARLFFMRTGVGYRGVRVKTIYAKHVYILSYRKE
ncbi:MAG: hypothetical protein ABIR91_02430 [Candidatus Saccharimonadales bacterium]